MCASQRCWRPPGALSPSPKPTRSVRIRGTPEDLLWDCKSLSTSLAADPLHRECGSGDSQVSVKPLASVPKLEMVVEVMRILAVPVVLIYGSYFSLTN